MTITESDSELRIIGATNGTELASLQLVLGKFVMEDDGRPVDGRQMELFIGPDKVRHESEGYAPLTLPPLAQLEGQVFNDFLYDPRVRAALARWSVHLEEAPVGPLVAIPQEVDEVAQVACGSYSGCAFSSCAQKPILEKQLGFCEQGDLQNRCCTSGNAAQRRCGFPSGWNACGAQGQSGAGCSVCWIAAYSQSCTASSGAAQNATCSDFDGSHTIPTNQISMTYN